MRTKVYQPLTKQVLLMGLLLFASLLLAACTASVQTSQPAATSATGGEVTVATATTSGGGISGAATPTRTQPPAAAAEVEINVATDPTLGEFLVDGEGMTLYMFKVDERDKSNCDANCLAKWPPFITLGNPIAGPGVDASDIGTATLSDGRLIVTYDHKPLYYWINDVRPGDVTGQGVGDVWFVMSPTGEEIDDLPAPVSDPTAPAPAASNEATLNVATDPQLGDILVDAKGMTLYMFTRDTADTSNCFGDCLVQWPPLLTQGNPILGEGVDPSLVGTAQLADGSLIVTYNHMPLYYWFKDTKPGDVTGQDVGGVWYVVSPQGEVIGR